MTISSSPWGELAPSLSAFYGPEPALQGVHVTGHLEGLLMRLSLAQSYVNTSDEDLEVTYTFPLGHGAQLLGLSVVSTPVEFSPLWPVQISPPCVVG